VQYGLGEHLTLANEKITFGKVVYSERRDFFHAGLRRYYAQQHGRARAAVLEAGMGFAFLGVVIGYLPVVYIFFAAREN